MPNSSISLERPTLYCTAAALLLPFWPLITRPSSIAADLQADVRTRHSGHFCLHYFETPYSRYPTSYTDILRLTQDAQ